MSTEKIRTVTKQPRVYLNWKTGKYDVKYNYTEYDPFGNKKRYKSKWIYGINSYKTALNTLAKMKSGNVKVGEEGFMLKDALELWMTKADANEYSRSSVKNTKQQYWMITKFWSLAV